MEIISVCAQDFPEAALRAMCEAIPDRPGPVVALPTGRTMAPVYAALHSAPAPLPSRAHYVAVDEYCWPDRDHPALNAGFFRIHWPVQLGLPPVAVPPADAPDPAAAIAHHCAEIAALGGIDVAVLGLGENGHVAFNEPGSDQDSGCRVIELQPATRDQVRTAWADPPAHGMTLGMRELLAARQIILLASGAAKRAILNRALYGQPSPEVPASLLQRHPRLTVVCDQAAYGTRHTPQ